MNFDAHVNIICGAFNALPGSFREPLEETRSLLADAANYPDLFESSSKKDSEKEAVDVNWKRYTALPKELGGGETFHTWPHSPDEQDKWRPLTEYWLQQAVSAYRCGEKADFIKFMGCLSHFMGDVTQPAHLMDLRLMAQLMPRPRSLPDFDYHFTLEAVTGSCGQLQPAQLLGTSVVESAWRLASLNAQARNRCRRYIVPTLQALFAGRKEEAEHWAEFPVTEAAQLTLSLLLTGLKLATDSFTGYERESLGVLDLRQWAPNAEQHDLVYGSEAILDGNRDVPPWGGPIHPARLRFENGEVRPVKGLGVLPHSGMLWGRDCTMRYSLPRGVFARFEAAVGMHADLIKDGAADFVVELNGQEAFRSGRRTGKDPALPVAVKLGQSAELTLKVEDANEGKTFWNNHAFWAEPRLVKASAT